MIRWAVILTLILVAASASAADPPESLRADDLAPVLGWRTAWGETDSVADHNGRWLLLKIGAFWCMPCVAEFDQVSAVRTDIVEAGKVDFAFVSWRLPAIPEEHFRTMERQLRQAHHSNMPVLEVDLPERFRSSLTIPYTALIDPHGRIVAAWAAKVGPEEPETDADWADRTLRVLSDQNLMPAR